MKKLIALVLLLPTLALAGDLHMASHAGKAAFKSAKFSGKMALKVVNKARKQVL